MNAEKISRVLAIKVLCVRLTVSISNDGIKQHATTLVSRRLNRKRHLNHLRVLLYQALDEFFKWHVIVLPGHTAQDPPELDRKCVQRVEKSDPGRAYGEHTSGGVQIGRK